MPDKLNERTFRSAPANSTQRPAADAALTPSIDAASERLPPDPARRFRIEGAFAEIDLADPQSIIFYGNQAQNQITAVADQMLEGVRNKDIGPAGEALSEMLAVLRGFSPEAIEARKSSGLLGRLFGTAKPMAKFAQRYETVRSQIDAITDRLDTHRATLLHDIVLLDRLYDRTLEYFHGLADYIAAGEEKLAELDSQLIPDLQRRAETSGDVIEAQELRDLRAVRDDLERRVHDLKLTRQVAMQSLPSIRLVQENNKGLVTKITSVLANTVALWRQQLAQAATIHQSREAGKAVREANDLTNELLIANARNLQTANVEIRQVMEQGIVDAGALKQANDLLIQAIEDTLQIADAAKQQRRVAEQELDQCEARLRAVLLQASERERRGAPPSA